MNYVALQMLFGDRAKYLGLIFAIAFSTFLMSHQSSIFAGIMNRTRSQIKDVRDAISANSVARMQTSTNDLEQAIQRIGQEVYGQSGAAESNGRSSSDSNDGSDKDSGFVEGEYREV